MEDRELSAEELIRGMNPDEICELLQDMGINIDERQAVAIQGLINRLGSLQAAFAALGEENRLDEDAA